MIPTPNDGTRPSKLELDRYATGELYASEAVALEARLDDRARAHLDAVAAARSQVPAFDAAALRARATALPASATGSPGPNPLPANDNRSWLAGIGLLLAAALALFVVLQVWGPTGGPDAPDTVRFRTGDALSVHQLQGRRLFAYEAGTPIGEGDVLGFRVNATGRRGVVLLSVDGNGTVSVFFPAAGSEPEPLDGDGFVALDGTVTLDGAPGPEVFVAVFDKPVDQAKDEVQRAFQSGGHPGLVAWASGAEGVDAVEVTRR
jgi:hypothetical protein